MPRLLIYNPETDYALASGSANYTPPRSIMKMRADNALLPLAYARTDDAILLLDRTDVGVCSIPVLNPDDPADWSRYTASPWGWNHQIARFLTVHCPGIKGIPSIDTINTIRELSHRRTTIQFLRQINTPEIELPAEYVSTEEALTRYDRERTLFFKAPWSSSGRGILYTADTDRIQTEQWLRGTIRTQGSVMAEPAYQKIMDCATEWQIDKGKVRFLGVSVFEASTRGKYHRNIQDKQAVLWDRIPGMNTQLIESQRMAIQNVLTDGYEGPLGIDMLVTSQGIIHPCVEINLRNTMGSILIHPEDRSLVAKFPMLF